MTDENATTKIICPYCKRVHKKSELCVCKRSEWTDPNLFDR